ncbi:3823_t:CDS:10 [Entrophospora sp. SA101]|nr:3823_t:CDS:10 [Entrophospora sp. SA101]
MNKSLFRLPFESNDDELGPWNVLLSDHAIQDIQELQMKPCAIDALMKKLFQISHGKWNKHGLQHTLQSHSHVILPIYVVELKPPNCDNLKILWQVDYGFSIRDKSYIQHAVIWAVTVNEEQTNERLENIALLHQVYTPEHKDKCAFQQIGKGGIVLPKSFEDEGGTKSTQSRLRKNQTDDENLLKVHEMLTTNKFVPLSKSLFLSLARGGTEFTFQVSKLEYEIINHPSSAIVIGRSGTGKTTCIVFRLLASYLKSQPNETSNDNGEDSHKRQIFITLSDNLCHKVKENFNKLLTSVAFANKRMYKDQSHEESDNIDVTNDTKIGKDKIPNSFRLLTKDHFPLIITYEKFIKMLLGTYDINGSNPNGEHLSREDYQDISTKKFPTFCYNRDEIYDLFLEYEKRKEDYDSIDLAIIILQHVKMDRERENPFNLQIHEVYIDECQDNSIVGLALILKLFERVDNIFLAGDIAQCIARGSSFRFQDLKAFVYKWERDRPKIIHNQPSAIMPKLFEMNINYRSHNGILRLASSVIDLITQFFPESIDQMPRECGEVGGPQPIVFEGIDSEAFFFHDFSEDGNESSNIEFGAEQVIIVRDDEAKEHVKKKIGEEFGLILTVFESKGMEFNDVLLYNFFADSPACSKWRVIFSAFDNHSKGIQEFYHEKHYILSSELKHLYVAVTRARQQIWIYDENTEWSEPVCKYWEHHKLVNVINIVNGNSATLSTLAKKSSQSQWDQQGEIFFKQQQYDQAAFCFKKSKNEKYNLAKAKYLQQFAKDSIYDSDVTTVNFNFVSAAEAFLKCSLPINAASCYLEVNMYEKAGDIYVTCDKLEYAAHFYSKANKWDKVGDTFQKAKKYDKAFLAYKDGKFYEKINDLVKSYRQEIDENLISTHYRSVARGLCSCGKFEEAINNIVILKEANSEDLEVLKCFLNLCRVNIIKNIMTFSNTKQEVKKLISKANNFVKKFKSHLLEKSEQWESLMKEIQLYSAYLNKDLNSVNECIQFFRSNQEPVTEFCAVNISPHQNIDNINKIHKDFKEIFFVRSHSNKWKFFLGNPFLNMWDEIKHEIIDDEHVYNANILHIKMKQFLASYIFKLICDVDKKSRQIPNISFHICRCKKKPSCENHHVIPTPLVLHQRLKLASLNYTVIQQLDIMYHCNGLLSKEQSEKVPVMQGWWTEKLVEIHIRYQSPQISCPEMTQVMLSKLPMHTFSVFISYVQNIWVAKELKLSQPDESLIGFEEYHGYKYYEVIPVGKRLSLFFEHLYKNYVIDAILHASVFIQYALDNAKLVHLDSPNALGDIVSLMEFKVSLVFMAGPEYCDFCLPQAYLVNYFKAFTVKPLFFNLNQQNAYHIDDYLAAIDHSFKQIKQLLQQGGDTKIKLRLIRLLVLISLNESTFAQKIFDLFNHLNNKISSPRAKKYLSEDYMKNSSPFHLMNILSEDLSDYGLDSLVIVHYNCGGTSKFSNYESQDIVKLTYSSIKEFHFALQQIISPVATSSMSVTITNEDEDSEITSWFQQTNESATKIQTWIRHALEQKKSHQLQKIYNEIITFCQGALRKKKEKALHKYIILLRDPMVDVTAKLNKMQSKMDATKDKLNIIKDKLNKDKDMDKAEECLNLLEKFNYTHYKKNVKQALDSLATTENVEKLKQENVEWLENKLQEAHDLINQV